jgi:hypothetical protein
VDFTPYEGAPLASGNQLKRTSLVIAISALILAGAGWLAVLTPVSNVRSFDDALGKTRSASVATAPLTVVVPTLLAGVASSDSDFGPGGAESELACQAAESKVALRPVPAPKVTAPGFAHPKLAAR